MNPSLSFREVMFYSLSSGKRMWCTYKQNVVATAFTVVLLFLTLPETYLNLMYYLILGIFSTIGLGTGIHTRLLFLWPMIAKEAALSSEPFASVFWKVLPASVFHGIGSTLGELPPYVLANSLVSRYDLEENRVYKFTVDYIRRYGWMCVFAFGVYPNTFFDMCGIACGAAKIPVSTFLLATAGGKAFVRAPLTAILIISAQRALLPTWVENQTKRLLVSTSSPLSWNIFVGGITVFMLWSLLYDLALYEKQYSKSNTLEKHNQ